MKRFRMKHTVPVLRPKFSPVPSENFSDHEDVEDLAANLPAGGQLELENELENELNRSQRSSMEKDEHSAQSSNPGPSSTVNESNLFGHLAELQDGSYLKDSDQMSKASSSDVLSNESQNEQNQFELSETLKSCINQSQDCISNETQSSTESCNPTTSALDIKGNVSSVSMDNQNVNITIKFPIDLFRKISLAVLNKQKLNVLDTENESETGVSNQILSDESCGMVTLDSASQGLKIPNDTYESRNSENDDIVQVVHTRPENCFENTQATAPNRTTERTIISEVFTEMVSLSLSTVAPDQVFDKSEEISLRIDATGVEDSTLREAWLGNVEIIPSSTTKVTEECVINVERVGLENTFKETAVIENDENTQASTSDAEMVTHEKTTCSNTETLAITDEAEAEKCHRYADETSRKSSSSVTSDHSPSHKTSNVYDTEEISADTYGNLGTAESQNVSDSAEIFDSNTWYGIVPLPNVENVQAKEIKCEISNGSTKYYEIELSSERALIKVTTKEDTDVSIEVVKFKTFKDSPNIATGNSSNEPENIQTDIIGIDHVQEDVKSESAESKIPDNQKLQQKNSEDSFLDLSQNDVFRETLSALESTETNQMTSEDLNEDEVVHEASDVLAMGETVNKLSPKTSKSKTAQKTDAKVIEPEHTLNISSDMPQDNEITQKSFDDSLEVRDVQGISNIQQNDAEHEFQQGKIDENSCKELEQNEYIKKSLTESDDGEIIMESSSDLPMEKSEQGTSSKRNISPKLSSDILQTEIEKRFSEKVLVSEAPEETLRKLKVSENEKETPLQIKCETHKESCQQMMQDRKNSKSPRSSTTFEVPGKTSNISGKEIPQKHSELLERTEVQEILECNVKRPLNRQTRLDLSETETAIEPLHDSAVGKNITEISNFVIGESSQISKELAVNKPTAEPSLTSKELRLNEASLESSPSLKDLVVDIPTEVTSPLSKEQAVGAPTEVTSPLSMETAIEETTKEISQQSEEMKESEKYVPSPLTRKESTTEPLFLPKELAVYEPTEKLALSLNELSEVSTESSLPSKKITVEETTTDISTTSAEINEPVMAPLPLKDLRYGADPHVSSSKEMPVRETTTEISLQSMDLGENETIVVSWPSIEMAQKESTSELSPKPQVLSRCENSEKPLPSSQKLTLSEPTVEPSLILKQMVVDAPTVVTSSLPEKEEVNEPTVTSLPLKELAVSEPDLESLTSEELTGSEPKGKSLSKELVENESFAKTWVVKTTLSVGKHDVSPLQEQRTELTICESAIKSSLHSTEIPEEERDTGLSPEFVDNERIKEAKNDLKEDDVQPPDELGSNIAEHTSKKMEESKPAIYKVTDNKRGVDVSHYLTDNKSATECPFNLSPGEFASETSSNFVMNSKVAEKSHEGKVDTEKSLSEKFEENGSENGTLKELTGGEVDKTILLDRKIKIIAEKSSGELQCVPESETAIEASDKREELNVALKTSKMVVQAEIEQITEIFADDLEGSETLKVDSVESEDIQSSSEGVHLQEKLFHSPSSKSSDIENLVSEESCKKADVSEETDITLKSSCSETKTISADDTVGAVDNLPSTQTVEEIGSEESSERVSLAKQFDEKGKSISQLNIEKVIKLMKEETSKNFSKASSLPDDSAEENANMLFDTSIERNEAPPPKCAAISNFPKSSGDTETHQEENSKHVSHSDRYKSLESSSADSNGESEVDNVTTSLETEKKSEEADSNRKEKEEIDTISIQVVESKSEDSEDIEATSREDTETEDERVVDKHSDQVAKDVLAVSKGTDEEKSSPISVVSLPEDSAEGNKNMLSDTSTERNDNPLEYASVSSFQKSSGDAETNQEEYSKHISHSGEHKSLERTSADSGGESEVDGVTISLNTEKNSEEADYNQKAKTEICTISKRIVESKSEGSKSTDEEKSNVKSSQGDSAEGNKNILSDISTESNVTPPKNASVSISQKSSGDAEIQEEYSKHILHPELYKSLESASADSDGESEVDSVATSLENEKKTINQKEKEEINTISKQLVESKFGDSGNVKTASSEDKEIENERLMEINKLSDQAESDAKDTSVVSVCTDEEQSSPTMVKSREVIKESQNISKDKISHESQKVSPRRTLRSGTTHTESGVKSPNKLNTSTDNEAGSSISKDQKSKVSRETRRGKLAVQEKIANKPQISDEVDSAPTLRRLRMKNPTAPPLSKDAIPENQPVAKEQLKEGRKFGQSDGASTESASPIKRTLRNTGHSATSSTSASESKAKIQTRRLSAESQKTSTPLIDSDMRRTRAGTPDRKLKERVAAPVRSSPRKILRSSAPQVESRAESSSTPSTRSNRSSLENKNSKGSSSSSASSSTSSARKTRRGPKD